MSFSDTPAIEVVRWQFRCFSSTSSTVIFFLFIFAVKKMSSLLPSPNVSKSRIRSPRAVPLGLLEFAARYISLSGAGIFVRAAYVRVVVLMCFVSAV